MNSPPSPPPPDGALCLPAVIRTADAAELRAALVLAAESGAVTIDASGCEHAGQAGFQLLVAARRDAEARGHGFSIVAPSAAFAEQCRWMGLDEMLGMDSHGKGE